MPKNRLGIALTLALVAVGLSVSGCAGMLNGIGGVPPSPAAVADRTVLDEQAALSVELAYQASSIAIRAAVSVGAVRGENAARVAEIDRKAYRAVLAARAAYDAGNAVNYGAAVATARAEVASLLALFQ
ncbi:hypothetical protein I6F37_41275 [Bradyrhizobium sp. NBAIM08]|nr:hypothetical protein [Bradyrhizobium sp. NBAIM08]